VHDFTRFREGQKPSTLDLIFTNEQNVVDDLKHLAPLGSSDHVVLTWKYVCKTPMVQGNKGNRKAYWHADYNEMSKAINMIRWQEVLETLDVENSWQLIKNEYIRVVDKWVPDVKPRKHKKI
jgi:hypothetical protein